MQSSLGQTTVDDRQLMLAGLIHEHIHIAVLQYTGLIRLTKGSPQAATIVLPGAFHTQQQMIAHMSVLELVCSQHFGQERLSVQEFRAGHQHRLPRNILIIEGTHHRGLHQAAHDGEQVLEVQVHLVGLRFGKHNHHGQLAIGMHARRIHWKVLFKIAVYPQSAMIQGRDNVGIILKQHRFTE